MNKSINQSILVTGASGFLGNATLGAIRQANPDTLGLARSSINNVFPNMANENNIVCPSDEWASAITSVKPKTLVLCDWEGVGGVGRDDAAVQRKNILRWLDLFEAAKTAGTTRIVAFGSQAEITNQQDGVKSDIEFAPRGKYGEAKAELFKHLKDLADTSDIQFDWIRIFSLYGDGSDKIWLIPKVISSLRNAEAIALTKCEQEWNFLHVEDASQAVVRVLGQNPSNRAINVANPATHKLREVLNFLGERMNRKDLLRYGDLEYPGGQVMVMRPNLEEILSTGWSPRVDLYEYLEREI
jgi:nucleoside-diphosphate-sugar epimerase